MYATHKAARNEFEVWLVGICLFLGFAQTFYAAPPDAISDSPASFQIAWAWTLLAGSAIALLGIFWRDVYTGLVLELAGLFALGTAMATYAGIVWWASESSSALVSIPITLAFSAAAFRRCWKICRKIFDKKTRQQSLLNEIISRKAVEAIHEGETGELPIIPTDPEEK